jgi:hypothetical protein
VNICFYVCMYQGSRYQVPGTHFGKILDLAFLLQPIQGGLQWVLLQECAHVKISHEKAHFLVGICLVVGQNRGELGGQGVYISTFDVYLQGGNG